MKATRKVKKKSKQTRDSKQRVDILPAKVGGGAADHPDVFAGGSIISIYLLLLFTAAGVAASATMTA